MAPSIYHPGPHLDHLLDALADMGCPPAQWGRQPGNKAVWVGAHLPGPLPGSMRWAEHLGADLDLAAKAMLVLELACDDSEQQAATSALGAEA